MLHGKSKGTQQNAGRLPYETKLIFPKKRITSEDELTKQKLLDRAAAGAEDKVQGTAQRQSLTKIVKIPTSRG